ncbi:efflux RND transporter periplasmic adaptor subunit [Nonomuraea cavernae]|uniref:Peptidoglycan-binding protein n=1 Tax=Nonomuraea cavernae TaxID=2045107 RepID=A0A918DGC9_9ACTN|nr:peptidoglycan-binding protein [Nonomuraea cavernae]MCA2184523.1 peptidoglycan-binding protein [Nonomuraea cavernae]GGO63531.1 peptidoglycan-binding protein [Nonomuraea cavernae]
MRRSLTLAGGGLLAAAAAWTGMVLLGESGTGSAEPATPAVPATAQITRQDLVDTKTVDGSLTYSGEREVGTDASGTVTWVPAQGALIRRGRPLLRVDRKPVVLMYGKLPLYRELRQGVSDGPDVRQLERNLKALGYGEYLTVDDHFSYATHLAVQRWQDDRGLPETGRVDAAQVVFLPGVARVTDVKAEVGGKAGPGRPVLTVSGVRRLVHVDLGTGDQAMARRGAKVTVELPGGERATGTITSVGTVAESSGDERDGTTTVDVDITLAKPPKTRLDQAPVEVEMQSERHENVLAVPVEALLALREGGFGVEVVEGAATRIVSVKTGAFGGGLVEIEGDGLAEGMKVGVPAS